ncbi:hypothetical protein RM549_07655 [Salegentibacter sp. F188]|uniref:DUF4494 domain-containing protein n=1 Tax=Autumnicola patrickiae TaxID=3075591 RepID=A0ABU3E112_9FLAO|nr:hypothetical protein [Salegentibacter sp. F188]MDT0689656.1 hypothetical protein [Salegentibacter sp. F188]
MKLQIEYKSVNVGFSTDQADEDQNGQKYHWTKSYGIDDVEEVQILEDEIFLLNAELEDGTQLQKEIKNVFIVRVITADHQKDYAVSGELLHDTSEITAEKDGLKNFCFYLNEVTTTVEIIEGVFLTEDEAYGDGFEVI